MNQLNMLIIFVLLFSGVLGDFRRISNQNIAYLNRVLNYSFKGFMCVQIFSQNNFPLEYYKLLPAIGIPVIINQSHKYCYGYVIYATDTVLLKEMLLSLKKYYNHRIVGYLQYRDPKLDDLVKNESNLFGESEALVTDGYLTYKLDQLEKRFYKINLETEQGTWGIQRPIINFKGREITVAGFNVSKFTEFGPVDEKGHPGVIITRLAWVYRGMFIVPLLLWDLLFLAFINVLAVILITYSSNKIRNDNPYKTWTKGIELHVLSMMAPLMNITLKIKIIKEKWGMPFPNGTWATGLFNTVMEGQADIGMGSIWMSIDKYESMSLSSPISMLRLKYLIRRPETSNAIWSSFFRHNPLLLWALLFLAAFINVLAVILITYYTNKIRNDIPYKKWSAISACSLMTFGAISVDASLPPHKNPGPVRFLLSCWAITTFILMTNFGSSLISHLTTPDLLHHRPENIKGLVEGGYLWGLTYPPDFERILDMNNPWHKKWAKRFIAIKDKEEHMRLLANDKFVLMGKIVGKMFVMVEDYWSSDLLSGFEVSSETLAMFYTTFIFTPGSQLLPAVNKYSKRIIETGHMRKYLKGSFMMEADPYMSDVLIKTKPGTMGYTNLTLSHFQGVFYILIVGLSIAIVVFCLELIYYKFMTN